jgi:tripartite-type tricarboxylate transporter receptor subunit TctC
MASKTPFGAVSATGFGLLAAVAISALLNAASADSVAEFYRKNPIMITVGGTSQGGYAAYARVVGEYLGDYIPGHPTVNVQYMPGAGSIRAANYIYNNARKNGTEIGAFEMPVLTLPLYDPGAVRYDSEKFAWLGSMDSDVAVCYVRADAGVATLEQAMRKEVVFGATAPSANTGTLPAVLDNLLKTRFRIITGYSGPDLFLAIQRNEVQGECEEWSVVKMTRDDMLKSHAINLLVQLGDEKKPEIHDVPLVMDFVKSDAQRAALAFIFGPQKLGRPFAAPPQIPIERAGILRKAFADVAKDPRLIATFDKQHLGVSFTDGGRMQSMIAGFFRTPKAIVDIAVKAERVADSSAAP